MSVVVSYQCKRAYERIKIVTEHVTLLPLTQTSWCNATETKSKQRTDPTESYLFRTLE